MKGKWLVGYGHRSGWNFFLFCDLMPQKVLESPSTFRNHVSMCFAPPSHHLWMWNFWLQPQSWRVSPYRVDRFKHNQFREWKWWEIFFKMTRCWGTRICISSVSPPPGSIMEFFFQILLMLLAAFETYLWNLYGTMVACILKVGNPSGRILFAREFLIPKFPIKDAS